MEHVGSARDDAELAVLMSQARQRLHGVQDDMLDFTDGDVEQSRPVGPRVAPAAVWCRW